MDPRPSLAEFAQRATRYSINLNRLVDRDTSIVLVGGQAKVYKGTLRYQQGSEPLPDISVPSGTEVAIKTMREHPRDVVAIKNVLREVHIWSKLSHDNVLKLLGIVTTFDDSISIISEWMEKGNAHEYVQDRDVDPRPLILDIAKGLEYLHGHKQGPIYHGDLKGSNVLIASDGRALLTDFGLSYLTNSSFSFSLATVHGGTIRHSSPENLDNSEISSEGDIWAFGMTVLELFTGRLPFHDIRGMRVIICRILQGPHDRPSEQETCGRLTDLWWNICISCWEKEPSSRPGISDIVEKLKQTMETTTSELASSPQVTIPIWNDEETKVVTYESLQTTSFQDATNLSQCTTMASNYFSAQTSQCSTLTSWNRTQLITQASEIEHDDIVILIFESMDPGTSNFISTITGLKPALDKPTDCTRDISVYVCDNEGRRFVFVVTPDFAVDSVLLERLASWLRAIYQKAITPTGVVCTRRITDPHCSNIDLYNIQIITDLCGNEAADRVRLVTTMWHEVQEQAVAEEREGELKTEHWKSLLDAGARCERFVDTFESAWKIVLGLGDIKKTLLLQRELVDEGVSLENTSVGRRLRNKPGVIESKNIVVPSRDNFLSLQKDALPFQETLQNVSVTPTQSNLQLTIEAADIDSGDNIILVLGPSCSGKSNLIDKLTGMQPESRTWHTTCARDVKSYACHRGGQRFVFVDTPGFDGTHKSQYFVLQKITEWLDIANGKSIKPISWIYTRSITDQQMTGAEFTSFRKLSAFCGREAPDRIRLISTMLDSTNAQSDLKRAENDLKRVHWNSFLDAGARYERFHNTSESAWQIVQGLYDSKQTVPTQGSTLKRFRQVSIRENLYLRHALGANLILHQDLAS